MYWLKKWILKASFKYEKQTVVLKEKNEYLFSGYWDKKNREGRLDFLEGQLPVTVFADQSKWFLKSFWNL